MMPTDLTLEEIRKVLPIVQLHCCGYKSRKFCDCKFGASAHTEKMLTAMGSRDVMLAMARMGEQTGCPEVRFLELFFSTMTETEFNRIAKRGDKEQTRKWKAYTKTPEYKASVKKLSVAVASINTRIAAKNPKAQAEVDNLTGKPFTED